MGEQIIPVERERLPLQLYKYKSLAGAQREHVRHLIVDQRFYFARPAELNDPFEFQPVLDVTATDAEFRRYRKEAADHRLPGGSRADRKRLAKSMVQHFASDLTMSYRKAMDLCGVFSMSARPLDLLMWPHYADNHRGICVRLDLMALTKLNRPPIPVTYSTERPVAKLVVELLNDPVVIFKKSALTKGYPWAYEEEWRIIGNDTGGQIERYGGRVVSGVILGAKISQADRNDVLEWVKESRRPMDVFEARLHDHEYALEADQLDLSAPGFT